MSRKILQSVQAALAELPPGAWAWLAISGGLDSMVLLEAARRAGWRRAVVAHVNHALRGEEADGDEAHVRAAAAVCGFEFRSTRLEWAGEKPSQAACRRRREEFFAGAMNEGDLLFLAHHANDQAETMLLRLLRGTGLDGLGGMHFSSGVKRRPLLSFPRAEIRRAAEAWGVTWREDSSNASAKYERNWVRNEVIPLLEQRRPGFAERLVALGEEVRALDLPKAAPVFEWGEFLFAKRAAFREERALKNTFALDRVHTRALAALFAKGTGECAAPGRRFRLSQGILLVERGQPFADQLIWSTDGARRVAESALGRWVLPAAAGDRRTLALGEKAKKNFQAARVPLFFRDSLPVLPEAKQIFLPSADSCAASALARWWLSSS